MTESLTDLRVRLSLLQRAIIGLPRLQTARTVAATTVDALRTATGAAAGILALQAADKSLSLLHPARDGSHAGVLQPAWELTMADTILRARVVVLGSSDELLRRYRPLQTEIDLPGAAWAAIPLIGQGSPCGAIGLTFPGQRTFTNDECEYMAAFGRVAGQAFERLRRGSQPARRSPRGG